MTTLPAGSPPVDGGTILAFGSTDMTGVALAPGPAVDSAATGFSSVLGVCTEMPPAPNGIHVMAVPRLPLPVAIDGEVVPLQPQLSTSPRSLRMKATSLHATDLVVAAEEEIETEGTRASLSAETAPATVVPVEIWGQAISAPVVVPPPDSKTAPLPAAGQRCPSPVSAEVSAPSDHAAGTPITPTTPTTPMDSTASELPAAATVERPEKPVVGASAALTPVDVSKPDARTEKIAVAVVEPIKPSLFSSENTPDNKFLTTDKQVYAKQERALGIVNAKSRSVMRTPLESTSTFPVAEATAGTVRDVAGIAPLQAGEGIAIASTRHTPDEPVLKISSHAVDAAGVVREVVELTHEFRARDRNSVEVKFNFKDDSELSVRLAYRDGEVHTTFRTDSDSLRGALSREWQGYVAGVVPQSRDYRAVEPVFTRAQDSTGSFEDRNSGSSAGGDARQQHAAHSHEPAAQRTGSSGAGFRSSSLSPAALLPAAGPRSSSDRLLHAFA